MVEDREEDKNYNRIQTDRRNADGDGDNIGLG